MRPSRRIVRFNHARRCFSSGKPDTKRARRRFWDCAERHADVGGAGANRPAAVAGDLCHERRRDGGDVGLHPARLRGADCADLSYPEQADSRRSLGIGAQSGRHRIRAEEQPAVAGVARERLEKPPRLSGRARRPYDGVGGGRQRLGRCLRPRLWREARPRSGRRWSHPARLGQGLVLVRRRNRHRQGAGLVSQSLGHQGELEMDGRPRSGTVCGINCSRG